MSVIPDTQELKAIHEIADELLASGLYKQKKNDQYVNLSHAEAFAKILFGWEIGIGAAQSMSALNIYQGKLSMSSALMTGLMVRGGFDWITKIHTDDECTLLIRNADKEELGEVTFTFKQAQEAGLPNKNGNWKTYRKDMLFARCISAAARRYASAVFGGNSVYTAEELGGEDKVVTQHMHNGNVTEQTASIEPVVEATPYTYRNLPLVAQIQEVAGVLKPKPEFAGIDRMNIIIDTIHAIDNSDNIKLDTSSPDAFKQGIDARFNENELKLLLAELQNKLPKATPVKDKTSPK